MAANASVLLRMEPEQLEQLKERHAQTYAEHRLSFNAWLLSRIMLSFADGGIEHTTIPKS